MPGKSFFTLWRRGESREKGASVSLSRVPWSFPLGLLFVQPVLFFFERFISFLTCMTACCCRGTRFLLQFATTAMRFNMYLLALMSC